MKFGPAVGKFIRIPWPWEDILIPSGCDTKKLIKYIQEDRNIR